MSFRLLDRLWWHGKSCSICVARVGWISIYDIQHISNGMCVYWINWSYLRCLWNWDLFIWDLPVQWVLIFLCCWHYVYQCTVWRLTGRGAVGIEWLVCCQCTCYGERITFWCFLPHGVCFNGNSLESSICRAEIYLMKMIYFVTWAVLVQYSSFIYMLVASIFSAV